MSEVLTKQDRAKIRKRLKATPWDALDTPAKWSHYLEDCKSIGDDSVADYWGNASECSGCIHLDKTTPAWCNLQDRIATYNPILGTLGLACFGMGRQEAGQQLFQFPEAEPIVDHSENPDPASPDFVEHETACHCGSRVWAGEFVCSQCSKSTCHWCGDWYPHVMSESTEERKWICHKCQNRRRVG